MEFRELSEKEFNEFEIKNSLGSFYQTIKWGKLKEKNGWKYFLYGVVKNNTVVAAALLLRKRVLGKLSIIYSPRGFLLDYKDYDLLKFFTENIKKQAKKEKAIFIKIDPYIIYKELDINGDLVKDGIDNSEVIENLKKLGYKHTGFNKDGNLQPRYAFVLDLKDKTISDIYDNMETTTKQMIRKNEKANIICREIKEDELNKYTDIMEDTAKRRGFIDRPYGYYKNMLQILDKNIKILLCEINLEEYISKIKEELNVTKEELKQKEIKLKEENSNKKKIQNQIKELEIIVSSLNKKIDKNTKLKEEKGNILELGTLMFIIHNKEILSLFGGAYGKYKDFMPAYSLNWEMIKYGINNKFEKYNFYGISEFKDKNSEMYGLYDFKRGFGGNVEEYVGEFNLIITKFWYFMYDTVYKNIYLKIKSKKSSN